MEFLSTSIPMEPVDEIEDEDVRNMGDVDSEFFGCLKEPEIDIEYEEVLKSFEASEEEREEERRFLEENFPRK